jgi:hypothetical protein
MLVVAASAPLPAWAAELPAGALSGDDLLFVTRLADLFIPATDTPGALAVKVPEAASLLIAGWAAPDTRQRLTGGLATVRSDLDRLAGKPFLALTPQRQAMILDRYDAAAFASGGPNAAVYREIKAMLVDLYYWSEPGASTELHYDPVPGSWQPCAPLADVGKTWAT